MDKSCEFNRFKFAAGLHAGPLISTDNVQDTIHTLYSVSLYKAEVNGVGCSI